MTATFLKTITGKLGEYVSEEVNVRTIKSCNDPLTYASLRAEPDFSVLGKRLGKAMGLVAKEVKSMTQSDILTFEKSGEATFAGHKLTGGDIKVIRDFRPPDGFRKEDIDAAGDGDVLVVLDLQPDESLIEAGFAREIVNRVQKLRKKAGLEPTDIIEVYYEVLEDDPPTSENNCLSHVIKTQAAYIKDSLGSPLLPLTSLPGHAVVIDSEVFKGVGGGTLEVTLSRTTLSFAKDALVQLCSGQAQHAENVQVYLLSRDLVT